MSFALLYWVIMLLWLVLGIAFGPKPFGRANVPDLILFALLLLVGWKVFGQPVHQ